MAESALPDPQAQAFLATIVASLGTQALEHADPGNTLNPATAATIGQADVGTIVQPPHQADVPTIQRPTAGEVPTLMGGVPTMKADPASAVRVARSSQHSENLARWSEFTIRDLVGRGGMGEIFRAGQNAMHREVAIKKIIPQHLESRGAEQMEQSFISEALITGFLDHPNIVPVYALGRDNDGKWFFTMKMVRGIEWRHLLHPDRCKNPEVRADALSRNLDVDDPVRRIEHLEENLRILLSVCNAVAFAHSKKIIHRDLKPENVMVGAFGEVLVMDWGLAVDVSEVPPPSGSHERRVPSRAECGMGGTPSYMAPEQAATDANNRYTGVNLNCWTDVFLLGAMLHELLTGTPPFDGHSISAVLEKVVACAPSVLPETTPAELAAICRKAMAKNPNERYADATGFLLALNDFLKHRESAAVAAKAEREAKGQDIPSLARAVVLYDQALELWPGNTSAQDAVRQLRTVLAQLERKARATRLSLFAAVACIIAGLAVGFFWIRSEQQKTMASMFEEKKAKSAAVASMIEEKKAKSVAMAAAHDEAVTMSKGLVAQGDAYLVANRHLGAFDRYQRAWTKFEQLGEPTAMAEWGMWAYYNEVDTPLLTLTDSERKDGSGAVVFSPDGTQALSTGGDNTLKLWDVSSGIQIAALKGNSASILCLAFSSDGKRALSASEDKTILLWDLAKGTQQRQYGGLMEKPKWVAFSTGDQHVLAGSSDQSIVTWDTESGEKISEFKRENEPIICETYSPIKQLTLSGGSNNALNLWDVAKKSKLREFNRSKDISNLVYSVAVSHDGTRGLSSGSDKITRLWSLDNGTELRAINGHYAAVFCTDFSADARLALTGSWDKTLKLWDTETGVLRDQFIGHSNSVVGGALSPNGRNVLSRSLDRTLKLWDTASRMKVLDYKGHTGGIECIAFSPNGKLLLSGGGIAIKVWDVDSGMEIRNFKGLANCAVFLPDGKRVVTASIQGLIQTWDLNTGQKTAEISVPLKCADFSTDGKFVLAAGTIAGGKSDSFKLWDVEHGKVVSEFKLDAADFYCVALSPDGKNALSITSDGVLKLWEVSSARELRQILPGVGAFYRAAFSPDGKRVITGNIDGTVQLWNVSSGAAVRELKGHTEQVKSMAFSPDGKYAVTGSRDKTIKLWDVESGAEMREFKGHTDAVSNVQFSPDGKRILSGGYDSALKLWDGSYPARYRVFEKKLPETQAKLAIDPNNSDALKTLGEWYAFRGVNDHAAEILERARKNGAEIAPLPLARCFIQNGDLPSAIYYFELALSRLRNTPLPEEAAAREDRYADDTHLSICLRELYLKHIDASKIKKNRRAYLTAVRDFLAVYEREINVPSLLAGNFNYYAWNLLTDPEPFLRDPKTALPFARRAVELTNDTDPASLDVLALALFRNDFKVEALQTMKKAMTLLPKEMSAKERKEYEDQLKEIEAGQ